MAKRTYLELMLVDRAAGWIRNAECSGCGQLRSLPFGLFVGSLGEPCGAIELCSDCAAIAHRLSGQIAELVPDRVSVLSGDHPAS
jgi:hypothetical protein